jgi:triacylglycerol lipase
MGSALRMGLLVAAATAVVLTVVAHQGSRSAGARIDRQGEAPVVVLLHGLGRSERSMRRLASRLEAAGFAVENLDYPSTRKTPEELVADLEARVASLTAEPCEVHFVGHSLGGLLARAYLAGDIGRNCPDNARRGRLVMLGSPNHGSEIVDELRGWRLFDWILGPAAGQLGSDGNSFPSRLGIPNAAFGVIAGTYSWNPLGSRILPGRDDGVVSVESTRLEGMSDFLVLPESHTFIMRSERVARNVVAFLRTGKFLDSSLERQPTP